MSFSNINNVIMVDGNLVDKILEQGQKLRNAMVESILKNDPFNSEVIYDQHFATPRTISNSGSEIFKESKVENLMTNDKRLEAFIKGDCMTKNDEKLALETLRCLSASDLFKTTQRSLKSTNIDSCRCHTCETYNSDYLKCDLRRKKHFNSDSAVPNDQINELTHEIQERYLNENQHLLQYVDSLRISVSSLTLSEIGLRKLATCEKNLSSNYASFFLECRLPENSTSILKKSKVDSGLSANIMRVCSKKYSDSTVSFKHVGIHNLKNLDKSNINNSEIEFKLSYRTSSQKKSEVLGYAKFEFSEFLITKNLTCTRALAVLLSTSVPISVGTLKVSIQLGCGKLYFGQEFIDAVYSSQKDNVVLESDDSVNQLACENDNIKSNVVEHTLKDTTSLTSKKESNFVKDSNEKQHLHNNSRLVKKPPESSSRSYNSHNNFQSRSNNENVKSSNLTTNRHLDKESLLNLPTQHVKETEEQILFGFLYISEAQYLSKPISTYFTCQIFCQNECSLSNLVTDSSNPIFNFLQVVPVLLTDDFLYQLRENYILIEFWQKTESADVVIGLTKISLHQFYLAYRNCVILKYLTKNRLPVIGTDWWEPIYTTDNEEHIGQVQILVALGTEEQITNLKSDRGFSTNSVKAKPNILPLKQDSQKNENKPLNKNQTRHKSPSPTKFKGKRDFSIQTVVNNYSPKNTNISETVVQKIDVATQSDQEMEQEGNKESNHKKMETKSNTTQEMLGTFLSQLMAQRQQNIFVENSTNTDPEVVTAKTDVDNSNLQTAQDKTNVQLRKTTDLLESLQKALSTDNVQTPPNFNSKPGCFRASVSILSANHLPVRKKCKSKKSKNRCAKNEENILPSCYVTFETLPEEIMKITPIVTKSTNPTWNFKCDVNLPINLLQNSQKRLIFKVWRKSNSTVTTPNMQADTVLGFAAVDLTVLLTGFPNIQGWFNIVDFSGKCNGQINIHVTPSENLKRFQVSKQNCDCIVTTQVPSAASGTQELTDLFPIEQSESLSRALKRKFTELDEITQRLRLRLSKVTNEDSDTSSDGLADEFEKDINTKCAEEDNLTNFEDEARKIAENINSGQSSQHSLLKLGMQDMDVNVIEEENKRTSELESRGSFESISGSSYISKENTEGAESFTSLDRQLQAGKQHISSLLEKLTLLTAEGSDPVQSRYVSGCSIANEPHNSVQVDTDAILKQLHQAFPNIQSSNVFTQSQMDEVPNSENNSKTETPQTSNSDTSLITDFSDCGRLAPEGEGNTSNDRINRNK